MLRGLWTEILVYFLAVPSFDEMFRGLSGTLDAAAAAREHEDLRQRMAENMVGLRQLVAEQKNQWRPTLQRTWAALPLAADLR